MTDILDEAINDYKEEKKLKRLKIFLISVFIGSLLGVLALFIYGYYEDKSRQSIQRYTEILLNLSTIDLQDSQYKQQIDILIAQKDKKIQELSILDMESRYIKNQNINEALQNLNSIISGNYSETVKKFALLSKFGIVLDKANNKNLDLKDKEFVNEFLQIFNNKSEIFYGKALIYKALWYISQGDNINAKNCLNKIKDNLNITESDRINADCILNNLEVESSKVEN